MSDLQGLLRFLFVENMLLHLSFLKIKYLFTTNRLTISMVQNMPWNIGIYLAGQEIPYWNMCCSGILHSFDW